MSESITMAHNIFLFSLILKYLFEVARFPLWGYCILLHCFLCHTIFTRLNRWCRERLDFYKINGIEKHTGSIYTWTRWTACSQTIWLNHIFYIHTIETRYIPRELFSKFRYCKMYLLLSNPTLCDMLSFNKETHIHRKNE